MNINLFSAKRLFAKLCLSSKPIWVEFPIPLGNEDGRPGLLMPSHKTNCICQNKSNFIWKFDPKEQKYLGPAILGDLLPRKSLKDIIKKRACGHWLLISERCHPWAVSKYIIMDLTPWRKAHKDAVRNSTRGARTNKYTVIKKVIQSKVVKFFGRFLITWPDLAWKICLFGEFLDKFSVFGQFTLKIVFVIYLT